MHGTTDTLIRTAVLAVTLINTVLTMSGHNPLPFAEEEAYTLLSCAVTIGATVWAWWKNNSFTAAAKAADRYLDQWRKGETDGSDCEGEGD
jgi:SPP1 family holin